MKKMTILEFISKFASNTMKALGSDNDYTALEIFIDNHSLLSCDNCPLTNQCPHEFACCENTLKKHLTND
jgi:hypothetical protein